MRHLWYIVQVDIPSSIKDNPAYTTNGRHWCVFYSNHPLDINLSDTYSR